MTQAKSTPPVGKPRSAARRASARRRRTGTRSRRAVPHETLADRLHSAAIHLLRRLRRVDEQTGLSGPQASALSVLVFGGPQRLGDLARAEQVRPPTMTRLVRDMERHQLVVRKADPRDGRVVVVHPTARGRRLLVEGRGRRVKMLAAQIARLSGDDRAALRRGIEALERMVVARLPAHGRTGTLAP
ncbi:MAG: MarR family transcriptional regulator [Phycisphaerales bacterium]|nr:MAG: MarR family transcriptional regulator [Phycisphaerales bacterium]